MPLALLVSVFLIATCGLVYELIAGALASYLLGDSVTQFSTVIGVYLFAMGIGSWASRAFKTDLAGVFVRVELLVALVGGFSASVLFLAFDHVATFRPLLYGLVAATGILVGLEIPLLMRILRERLAFEDLVSKVFTFDYVGALAASLLFPLVLVPHLGFVRSAFLFGMLNAATGLWTLRILREEVRRPRALAVSGLAVFAMLTVGFVASDRLLELAEGAQYPDKVVYAKSTPYQRIVLTRGGNDVRLYLNGSLQFSSRDEYRYHEALVHVGLSALPDARRVLVLGGGDGFAVREVLRYPNVEAVTLVELDPAMTDLFRNNDALARLNGEALRSAKVHVVNADAFLWLKEQKSLYDFVVVDFPDPTNFSLGKLYSTAFYRRLREAVAPGGAVVIQSTSPFVAKRSFWCVDETLRSVGFQTQPYHAYVPSFGEWGFVLASAEPLPRAKRFPTGMRFLDVATQDLLFHFPEDMRATHVAVNRLNNQALVRYFEEEWGEYAPR